MLSKRRPLFCSQKSLKLSIQISVFYVGKTLQNEDGENIEYYKRDCLNFSCKRYSFDAFIFSYKYDGIIRKLMLDFKFKNKKYLHRFFAYDLSLKIKKFCMQTNMKFDYIIAVPISFKRYMERGYNQSNLIARAVSHNLSVPLLNYCLIKTKHNQRQSELRHAQRRSNAQGAYKTILSKCLQGRSILLIDDIFTTGSTVEECCRVLKNAGVKSIVVATSTKA